MILFGRLSLYGRGAERLHEELVPVAARWLEPSLREGPLKAYARGAAVKSLELLEESLSGDDGRMPSPEIREKLLNAAPRDIEELRPQLDQRGGELATAAVEKLRTRGESEEKDLLSALENQQKRVVDELSKHEKHESEFKQLTMDFSAEEVRQLQSNMRAWRRRLEQFERDIEQEPQRVRKFYEVRTQRIEPIGLVYLWPETN